MQPKEADPGLAVTVTAEAGRVKTTWPELQWRGDGQKRALTCGTLMYIIGTGGGDIEDTESPGITVPSVVRELQRVAAKYDSNKDDTLSDKPVRGGDMIHTDSHEIVQIIAALCDVSGVIAIVNDAARVSDETTTSDDGNPVDTSVSASASHTDVARTSDIRLKLTARGKERLTAIMLSAESDKRFTHVDMSDPILEYNPVLDTTDTYTEVDEHGNITWLSTEEKRERERIVKAEEDFKEALLPKRRKSSARPSYRSWMWIVRNSPLTYAYASTKTPESVVLTETNTRPGDPYDKTGAALSDAYWIRPFLDLVLGGGPDGIWTGKPIQPHLLHQDVEDFTAAKRSGFTDDMVKMSSKAWEMFDNDSTPSTLYRDVAFLLRNEEQKRANSMTAAAVEELEMASSAREHELSERKTNEWTVSRKDIVAMKTSDRELRAAQATIIRSTSDALMDALRDNSIDPSQPQAWDWRRSADTAGTIAKGTRLRCTHVKTNGARCKYWGVDGSGRCELHGGRLLDEDETRSLIRAQQVRIFAASAKAVETLIHLMTHSANDSVRFQAASSLLNRAGLSERAEVSLSVDSGGDDGFKQDPAEVIRERLNRLAGHPDDAKPNAIGSAIDAEVIDESDVDDAQNSPTGTNG
jgi:hypothetical protein